MTLLKRLAEWYLKKYYPTSFRFEFDPILIAKAEEMVIQLEDSGKTSLEKHTIAFERIHKLMPHYLKRDVGLALELALRNVA